MITYKIQVKTSNIPKRKKNSNKQKTINKKTHAQG